MVEISDLLQQLAEKGQNYEHGFPFIVEEIPGEVTVLKVTVEDREELPVFVSITGDQLLCTSYLFKADEVKSDEVNAMNAAMLGANVAMPLSSFAKIDDQYLVFGALSLSSSLDDLVHEIEVLSSNSIDAIEAMREFLV